MVQRRQGSSSRSVIVPQNGQTCTPVVGTGAFDEATCGSDPFETVFTARSIVKVRKKPAYAGIRIDAPMPQHFTG
jgi:hypothetical protein